MSNDSQTPASDTVSLLIILKPRNVNDKSKYVVLAQTPDSKNPTQTLAKIPPPNIATPFSGNAVEALERQIGRELHEKDLVDLTALVQSTATVAEQLTLAVEGGAMEGAALPVFLWEMKEDHYDLETLKFRLTGLQEGKQAPMALKICDYEVLQKNMGNDPTIQAAWIMYEGLKKANEI